MNTPETANETSELDAVVDGANDAAEGTGTDAPDTAEVAVEVPKVAVIAKLIRGRMPLPLVFHVRFVLSKVVKNEDGVESYASDSDVATKMFTTAGKIMDIRTNANFKYLTSESTFSQDEINIAKAMLTKNIAEGKKRGAEAPSQDFTVVEAASLFAILDEFKVGASTIAADREAYNTANPRKGAAVAAVEAAPVVDAEALAATDEPVEGLTEDGQPVAEDGITAEDGQTIPEDEAALNAEIEAEEAEKAGEDEDLGEY